MRTWAEQLALICRRRRVSMDDLTNLAEGFRSAVRSSLGPVEQPAADAALDAAIEVSAGIGASPATPGKRNRLLQFIYKGLSP
jgi:hypothetical protein